MLPGQALLQVHVVVSFFIVTLLVYSCGAASVILLACDYSVLVDVVAGTVTVFQVGLAHVSSTDRTRLLSHFCLPIIMTSGG